MAVLISINKPHTNNIFCGDKSVEWRKKPLPEGLYYVYETKNKGGCGMVIGEMQIVGSKAVDTSAPLVVGLINAGCVHPIALKRYANNGIVYANFIKDAKRYENPRELSEFMQCHKCPHGDFQNCLQHEYSCDGTCRLTRPPQSWCYVEEVSYGK